MKQLKKLSTHFSMHLFILIPLVLLIIFGNIKKIPVPADLLLTALLSTSFYADGKTESENKKIYYGISVITGATSLGMLLEYLNLIQL